MHNMADELDWDDLRFFMHASHEKSLAAAGRKLGVKHTTVGRRLASLERTLQTALVLRGPDGLRLTHVGEGFLPLVEAVERAVQAAKSHVAVQRSRVRLAVPSGYTPILSPGLARLREQRPHLVLELVSGARPVDLKKGEADLALRNGPVDDPELLVRKVGIAGWSVYASKDYLLRHERPRNIDDLSGHEVVGYDAALASVPAAQWLEARSAGCNVVLRSREVTDMIAAVVAGIGLGVLPCSLAEMAPELERLTDEVVATRQISLVYRREVRLSRDIRAVMAYVAQVMKEQASAIRGERATKQRQ
jgi:DNA-binding transcriptional LysR family regulator